MPQLINAPLVYTIAVVRFPRIPNMEPFADTFFGSIREAYPHDGRFEQDLIDAEMAPSGLHFKHQKRSLWQYLSPERNCGFVLASDCLCFHTNAYIDSHKFLQRFKFGLTRLQQVEGINLNYINILGYRYVDLVIPENNNNLSDYLESWVLPKEFPSDKLQLEEGAYIAKYKTALGTINFQAIRNPSVTLPPDLQTEFTVKNNWMSERPESNFAIIDTDHYSEFSQQRFDVDFIISHLNELHLIPSKLVFDSIGTVKAKKYWSGK